MCGWCIDYLDDRIERMFGKEPISSETAAVTPTVADGDAGNDPAAIDVDKDADDNVSECLREKIRTQTPAQFQDNVDAAVAKKLEQDKTPWEESQRHWRELTQQSYLFDRYRR